MVLCGGKSYFLGLMLWFVGWIPLFYTQQTVLDD